MTFETAIVLSFVILVATAVAVLIVITRRHTAAKDEEMRGAAALRGWTFARTREGNFQVRRWTGTTDGVAWVAESLEGSKRKRGGPGTRQNKFTRWRTAAQAPAPHNGVPSGNRAASSVVAPIVCMGLPKGTQAPSFSVAQGAGWIAKLAQKAAGFAFDQAIDAYFGQDLGKEVDAAALRRVEGVAIPGFIVMAADTEAASRVLFQGLAAALTDAIRDTQSILSDENRPWVLLRSQGIALARLERVSSVEEIDRFVRAGVMLTRVPTRSG